MFQSLKSMRFSSSSFYNQPNRPSAPSAPAAIVRPMSLKGPMIERVYRAKPGCSACGKRVA
jgi:hypothetical protein